MFVRFDPFADLNRQAGRRPAIPMDAVRSGDQVFVYFDLPGVEPDSIDVTVEGDVLTVTAERHFERADDDRLLAGERRHGTFTRRLTLGENLDADGLEAGYHDGVLGVTIPVAEASKPRKVQVGSSLKELAGTAN